MGFVPVQLDCYHHTLNGLVFIIKNSVDTTNFARDVCNKHCKHNCKEHLPIIFLNGGHTEYEFKIVIQTSKSTLVLAKAMS